MMPRATRRQKLGNRNLTGTTQPFSGWRPNLTGGIEGGTGTGTTRGRGGVTGANGGTVQHLAQPKGATPIGVDNVQEYLANYVGFLHDLNLVSDPDQAFKIGMRLASGQQAI